jgi:hypothetical protein
MDLYQGEVPAACVWAVVMDAPPGSKDVSWFIMAETATDDYRDVVAWIKDRPDGGTAERWLVKLPGQRMEAGAVTRWVEALLLYPEDLGYDPTYARRLDVYRK